MKEIAVCYRCYGFEILEDYPRSNPAMRRCFFCEKMRICYIITLREN